MDVRDRGERKRERESVVITRALWALNFVEK
jgi:hypothetical protein